MMPPWAAVTSACPGADFVSQGFAGWTSNSPTLDLSVHGTSLAVQHLARRPTLQANANRTFRRWENHQNFPGIV